MNKLNKRVETVIYNTLSHCENRSPAINLYTSWVASKFKIITKPPYVLEGAKMQPIKIAT